MANRRSSEVMMKPSSSSSLPAIVPRCQPWDSSCQSPSQSVSQSARPLALALPPLEAFWSRTPSPSRLQSVLDRPHNLTSRGFLASHALVRVHFLISPSSSSSVPTSLPPLLAIGRQDRRQRRWSLAQSHTHTHTHCTINSSTARHHQ